MKQETLEEAFEKYSEYLEDFENKNTYEHGFKDGAKWQQERMYSEDDLKEAFEWGVSHITFEEWFKQYKKQQVMDSITIEVYPYLSTSFDVKVLNKGRESWFIVHTDDDVLTIEGDCTDQERAAIEAIFSNR